MGTTTAATSRTGRSIGRRKLVAAALALAIMGGMVVGSVGVDAASAALHPARPHRGDCFRTIAGGIGLNNVLDDLVADGTLDETQQAAILDRISEARAEHARPCTGIMLLRDGTIAEAVTGLLGMDRDEIRAAWKDGQSLSEMAEANGVDRQTLIDTIVDALGSRLDTLVADDKIPAERRGEVLDNARPVIERAVDLHRDDLRDAPAGDDSGLESSPETTASATLVA